MTLEEFRKDFASQGGKARAQSLSKEERKAIAVAANKARWDKPRKAKRKAA